MENADIGALTLADLERMLTAEVADPVHSRSDLLVEYAGRKVEEGSKQGVMEYRYAIFMSERESMKRSMLSCRNTALYSCRS